MQPTTCSAIFTEQMATLWRQADNECGTLFYQHHVILAVHRVLTDGGDLDMNLRFVAQLLDHLNFTFEGDVSDIAGQQMFRANTYDMLAPTCTARLSTGSQICWRLGNSTCTGRLRLR